MEFIKKFMAKKKVILEETSLENNSSPRCTVSDSNGNEVQVFNNVNDAYRFASENGYSVNISN